MSDEETSPVVRLYLAAALQRIPSKDKLLIASNLLHHSEDANDHNLPKIIWYGIESLVAENFDNFLELSSQSKIPFVTQNIARRVVDADEMQKLVAFIGKGGPNTELMLSGMLSGMEGRTDLNIPSNWKAVANKLEKSGGKKAALAVEISSLFGDTEATQRAFAILKDKNQALEQRQKALQTLTAQQRSQLIPVLPGLMEEPAMRKDAIRSIAAFDNENLGRLLIEKYPTFDASEKQIAIQTLSSRPRYGNMLTRELKDKKIAKAEVPVSVARQLLRVVGSGFIEVWGPIEQVPNDQEAYNKYRKMLQPSAIASANVKSGKTVFNQVCGSCHKMFGEGGDMGPDLTGSNRSDVEYILLNVIEPSAEIQDDYKMVVINTRDGSTYSGNIIGENQRQITLRVVGQDPVIINKSSIQSKDVTEVSMMPPGLFENLSEKEIVDLMGYLKTVKRVD
jgi:putative heme-binding domain-containing protein